jgi:dihydrofolate reductase
MKISSIVAMGKNRVIGADNQMIWHIPSEFEHYRSKLGDHYFVIGRKNYEGSKHKLNTEKAIVLSRSADYKCEAPVFNTPTQAITYAQKQGEKELFIMGGEQIYRTFMPLIDTLYLSIVDYDKAGDTYFPEHELFQWECKKNFTKGIDDQTPISWEYFELVKI